MAAEKFLTQETTFSNRRAYKDSTESTRDEAYVYLTSLAQKVEESGSDSVRLAYEKRIDIFNAADSLYGLFLPKGFDDPTSRKFWGALRKMLTVSFQVQQPYARINAYLHGIGKRAGTRLRQIVLRYLPWRDPHGFDDFGTRCSGVSELDVTC